MQIAFHIGANATDNERLLKSLLKNAESFLEQGIAIPGPGKYRPLLREAILGVEAGKLDPGEAREQLLGSMLEGSDATRIVLSQSTFLAVPNQIFDGGQFYGNAERKLSLLARIFAGDELEFHISLRNTATFIPAVFDLSVIPGMKRYLSGLDPQGIRWSDLLRRIQAATPEASITCWCNEDTPLIWAQLIRQMSGVDPLTRITGGFDLLAAIMSEDGMRRFLAYLKSNPPQTESQKRRIIAAFLDKYARPEEVEEELDAPGWTENLVEALSASYEADIATIADMPGIRFVSP